MRRIQLAALTLFERRGFERITIEDIARAARVGPATVYRHFITKERIVRRGIHLPRTYGDTILFKELLGLTLS